MIINLDVNSLKSNSKDLKLKTDNSIEESNLKLMKKINFLERINSYKRELEI